MFVFGILIENVVPSFEGVLDSKNSPYVLQLCHNKKERPSPNPSSLVENKGSKIRFCIFLEFGSII